MWPPARAAGTAPAFLGVTGGASPPLDVCLSPRATFRNDGYPNHHCSKATRAPVPDTSAGLGAPAHTYAVWHLPRAMLHEPSRVLRLLAPHREPLSLQKGQEGWMWGVTPLSATPHAKFLLQGCGLAPGLDGGMCRVSRPPLGSRFGGPRNRPCEPHASPSILHPSPPDNRETQAGGASQRSRGCKGPQEEAPCSASLPCSALSLGSSEGKFCRDLTSDLSPSVSWGPSPGEQHL